MATKTSVGSGLWSAAGTWDAGVPADNDTVVIAAGHTVEFDDEPIPEDTGEWQTKVIRFMKVKSLDGLNIRAEGRYGSSWQAWLPNGTIVPLLETVKRSGEIWHRIGYNQWCAELYNSTRFLI